MAYTQLDIAKTFDNYVATAYGVQLPTSQFRELRQAYFAGVALLYGALVHTSEDDAALVLLKEVHDQLDEFVSLVVNDGAGNRPLHP